MHVQVLDEVNVLKLMCFSIKNKQENHSNCKWFSFDLKFKKNLTNIEAEKDRSNVNFVVVVFLMCTMKISGVDFSPKN